jgi:hypothetical protein
MSKRQCEEKLLTMFGIHFIRLGHERRCPQGHVKHGQVSNEDTSQALGTAKLSSSHPVYCIPRPGAGIAMEQNRNTKKNLKKAATRTQDKLISRAGLEIGDIAWALGLCRDRSGSGTAKSECPQATTIQFHTFLSSLRFLSSSNSFPGLTLTTLPWTPPPPGLDTLTRPNVLLSPLGLPLCHEVRLPP